MRRQTGERLPAALERVPVAERDAMLRRLSNLLGLKVKTVRTKVAERLASDPLTPVTIVAAVGELNDTAAHDIRDTVNKAEWRTRVDLAAAYRLVDLFGWTLGGVVAQHVGLRRPGLVRKLVVAASTASAPRPGGPVAAGVEEVPGQGLRRLTGQGEVRLGSRAFCGGPEDDREIGPELWLAQPGRGPVRFAFAAPPRAPAGPVIVSVPAKTAITHAVHHATGRLCCLFEAIAVRVPGSFVNECRDVQTALRSSEG